MRDYRIRFVVFVFAAVLVRGADPVTISGRAMGTTWTVKFLRPTIPRDRDDIAGRLSTRLEELEQRFSTYRADSEVSRFNRSHAVDWQPVSSDVAQVAAESRAISELTDGAFDVTVARLVALWGFGGNGRRDGLPSGKEILAARAHVGWRDLEVRLSPPALRKTRPDRAADFSSMAKGFASDALVAVLREFQVSNAFVQIGGDIRTSGRGADGSGWRAGIEEPAEGKPRIACVIALEGQALSTSGDYRNAFVVEGRRYGHIIDPRTGFPAASGPLGQRRLAAVSVVHVSCAGSSAWATALFVLGPEDGWRVATRERLACLFFVREADDRVSRRMTPEFERFLR